MSSNLKAACLLLALLAGAPQTAHSAMCYQILDRDDSSIYSGPTPPFPMAGQEWTDGQQRLRAAGRHLLWFDTPACPLQTARSVNLVMGPADTVAQKSPAPPRRKRAAPPRKSAAPAPRTSAGERPPRPDRN